MTSDMWVFGYGSLIWRPGFDFVEKQHALLTGFNRSLCVYSVHHRGTRRRPGLVMGLDAGGTCEGMAFAVPRGDERAVLSYLRAREMVTRVYREVHRPVRLLDGSRRQVSALCYVVDRFHPQYAGHLPLARQIWIVREARGRAGRCLDYVVNTHAHLVDMGISDRRLTRLANMMGGGRVLSNRVRTTKAPRC